MFMQGLKLRKYFRGQVGPHQINFGSPHNLLGAHQVHSAPATSFARCPMAGGPLKPFNELIEELGDISLIKETVHHFIGT